jgi:hypothetical protein
MNEHNTAPILPESGGRESEPNTPLILFFGFVGIVLFFVIVVSLQTLFYTVEKQEFQEKVVSQPAEELDALRAQQIENINAYRWVEKASGVVAIPIERAMELVVRDAAIPAVAAPPGSATGS